VAVDDILSGVFFFSFSYPICLCVKKVPCSVLEYIRRQYKPATGRRIRKHDTGLLFFFRLWSELLCRPFAIFFGRSNNSSIGPFQTFSFQWVLFGYRVHSLCCSWVHSGFQVVHRCLTWFCFWFARFFLPIGFHGRCSLE
jgi:hypothetical protein